MSKQTRLRVDEVKPNDNKSLPFGLIRTVEVQMRRLGLTDFLDRLKMKGVPLSKIVAVMCTYQLYGGSSMNECGDWISDPIAVKYVCGGQKISGKTIERSLELLNIWFDDILDILWKGINKCYELTNTDVIIDGSHIPLNGVKSKLAAYGHGGNGIQNQMQFMVAQLKNPPLPFRIEAYAGNESDAVQFADFLPMIMRYLKKGSLLIMDNGGAARAVLDDIRDSEMEYLTRMKMNLSDDNWIAEKGMDFVCVDSDTCCLAHTFSSSGRTTYIFYSVDKYIRTITTARKKAERMAK